MQMLWQDHKPRHGEGSFKARLAECLFQQFDVVNQQRVAVSLGQVDSEAVSAAFHPCPHIGTHTSILAREIRAKRTT